MTKRILMIEDDKGMVALGRLMLEGAGYEVLSAYDGPTGLQILRTNQVDLVLLDIMMVEMDGWEVLDEIRSDNAFRDLPVIMLTAREQRENIQSVLEHKGQFYDYVVKPFVVRDLLATIRRALTESQPQEQNEG
ncbi:MAG: response regulator [Anaerolineae bacterium]|jgi:CheY-like chemotaxis protein|nr:response regulator [Anaerolineae bacterium]MDH7472495.1 response regulator [Anaerolineae bacterium]